MNFDQLKKNIGHVVQLFPPAHWLADNGSTLPAPNPDDWVLADINSVSARLESRTDRSISTRVGLDAIHSYSVEPNRQESGLQFASLMLKAQLTVQRKKVTVQPIARPGESGPPAAAASLSPAERIARLAEQKAFEQQTEALATGGDAHRELEANLEGILNHVSYTIANGAWASTIRAEVGGTARNFGVNLDNAGCYTLYRNQYGRVTAGSYLVRFYRQSISLPGSMQVLFGDPEEARRWTANVVRSMELGWCWHLNGKNLTSVQIAELIIETLLGLNT